MSWPATRLGWQLMDVREGEFPDPEAFKELVRAAAALNAAIRSARRRRTTGPAPEE